ncbi:MAG TPA: cation diffusion facilitator family transporter [Gemmatimonadales bacterium]|nr:cation diffusion facilitator family transporter [Gemmatimonadales bacterium]
MTRAEIPRKLLLVLILTGVFMVVEAVGGYLSGSLALIADAGHMLTDVGALALSLGSVWLARRPATTRRTFGFLRLEILAAFINGAVLLVLVLWIVIEALRRLRNPVPVEADLFLVIAIIGLVVNLVGLRVLHGDHQGSLNVRGAYLHVLGDALGSVAAISAALVIKFTGWLPADPIISLVLSLLILAGAWRLVRESVDILLEAVPAHVDLVAVKRDILAIPGVSSVHDLHVWTVTSGMVAMSGHVVVPELGRHPATLGLIQSTLKASGIAHTTIQLEVTGDCEGESCFPGLPEAAGRRDPHGHSH